MLPGSLKSLERGSHSFISPAGWRLTGPERPTSFQSGRRKYAAREIAKLQQDLGTKAEVIIDSGNVCKLLNRAVDQAKGDVLVIGHMPSGGHLGENGSGYAIIRESHIPVMSV